MQQKHGLLTFTFSQQRFPFVVFLTKFLKYFERSLWLSMCVDNVFLNVYPILLVLSLFHCSLASLTKEHQENWKLHLIQAFFRFIGKNSLKALNVFLNKYASNYGFTTILVSSVIFSKYYACSCNNPLMKIIMWLVGAMFSVINKSKCQSSH